MTAARAHFRRVYGKGPLHLIGHLVLIGITAWVLQIIFMPKYAPQPWNLVLWLLGGAVLHDGVFLPAWGLVNTVVARVIGASDRRPIPELAMGPPAGTEAELGAVATRESGARAEARNAADPGLVAGRRIPASRDGLRRVPIVNHVRVPILTSAILFLVFLPRILDRQPQNFVNALGHAPPDFFGRWVWVTIGLIVASALLYALRWVLASGPHVGEADAN